MERVAGIREVDAFMRGAAFRRKLLGCDLDEVQKFVLELSQKYKAIIASLLSLPGQEELIQELRASVSRLTLESEALYDWNARFQQTNAALFAEIDRLRQENAALQAERAQGGHYYT